MEARSGNYGDTSGQAGSVVRAPRGNAVCLVDCQKLQNAGCVQATQLINEAGVARKLFGRDVKQPKRLAVGVLCRPGRRMRRLLSS